MVRVLVSSFGGVGSKCLVKGLLQTEDKPTLGQSHTHLRTPPDKSALNGRAMIYVFGDPYDAVVSFFKRRLRKTRSHGFNTREGEGDPNWVVNHCKNLGGDDRFMNPQWDLEAYLNHGADLLKLREHFENWLNARTEYPILFVRYETMWDHAAEICRFVGLPESAADKFPPREPRGSCWRDEALPIQKKLTAMYGALHARIAAVPDIWIGGKAEPRDQKFSVASS